MKRERKSDNVGRVGRVRGLGKVSRDEEDVVLEFVEWNQRQMSR
jgi:hypothetical protein